VTQARIDHILQQRRDTDDYIERKLMNQTKTGQHPFEATHLRGNSYAVRPAGQCGTCGWHPFAWTVIYVNASSPAAALIKAGKA